MAAMAYPPPPPPPPVATYGQVAVVDHQFCAPYPVDLTITQKAMTLGDDFIVTDVNGNVMMKVKGKVLSIKDRRTLFDAAGNPIVTMQAKVFSAHRRWQVFRGESTDSKDLLFVLKKSSILQLKTELDVFLASNTREDVCDFKIKGSYFERSCAISLGSSNTIIAQMHRQHKIGNMILGKDTYGVTVYPNVDYAFIVSLVVILDEINEDKKD